MEISSLLFLSFFFQSVLNLYFHVFPWGKIVWLLFLGHEGDPCLRSSDCIEGHCCARHFWTKICKPVLRQGEVCTKQRKKGSHGLEIFQRCDCAKGLSCKVWKDATSSSKSRLHVCQKIWMRIGKISIKWLWLYVFNALWHGGKWGLQMKAEWLK